MVNIEEINNYYYKNKQYYDELETTINYNIDGRICHHRVLILDLIKQFFDVEIYVEIGVHNGASMSYAIQGKKPIKAIGIDLFESTILLYKKDNLKIDRTKNNIMKANNSDSELIFIKGNSKSKQSIEELEKKIDNKMIDLLFIDGDHTYYGVKSDFNNYTKFVKKGGIIIIDDYESTIWKDITKFAKDHIINNPNYRVIGVFLRNELIIEKL